MTNKIKITEGSSNLEKLLLESSDNRLFAYSFFPILTDVFDRLKKYCVDYELSEIIPLTTIDKLIYNDLAASIGFVFSRIFVYELHCSRKKKQLIGESPEERFVFFLKEMGKSDNRKLLFTKYPALEQSLNSLVEQFFIFSEKFLSRFAHDFRTIQAQLFKKNKIMCVNNIIPSGDKHRNGERVITLICKDINSNIQKILYKPRSLKVDLAFRYFLRWFNENHKTSFYLLNIIDQGTYGWVEHIQYQPCETADQVQQFYKQLGGLLAITYLLNGTDLHHENIIANQMHPVIVDCECLLQPAWKRFEDETVDVKPFVSKSMILHHKSKIRPDYVGLDISAISNGKAQLAPTKQITWDNFGTDEIKFARKEISVGKSQNSPINDDITVNTAQCENNLIEGFKFIYEAIIDSKDCFFSNYSPLNHFKNCEVRILLRNTQSYSKYLLESFHPQLLHNKNERLKYFMQMMTDNIRIDLKRAFDDELHDLYEMNIPIFTCYTDGSAVYNSNNKEVDITLESNAFSCINKILKEVVSKDDLELQIKLIRLSFITHTLNNSDNTQLTTYPDLNTKDILSLRQPINLADELLKAISEERIRRDSRVSWPSLDIKYDHTWSITFTDPLNFYNGNPGIALSFAWGGQVFNNPNYTDVAKDCVGTLFHYLDTVPKNANISLGAYDGIGGVLFVFNQIYKLWGDETIISYINKVVDFIPRLLKNNSELDVISGVSGCILGLYSARDFIDDSRLKLLLNDCVANLLDRYPNPVENPAVEYYCGSKPLLGFSHGISGFVYSLVLANKVLRYNKIDRWISQALNYERSCYSYNKRNWPDYRKPLHVLHRLNITDQPDQRFTTAWCHGAPGIALSRIGMKKHGYDDCQLSNEIHMAIKTTIDQGFASENHCLCHGLLGNLDVVLTAKQEGYLDNQTYTRIEKEIIQSIRLNGLHTNNGLSPINIPGLMMGAAGIAYQLMRLENNTIIPSVLLME